MSKEQDEIVKMSFLETHVQTILTALLLAAVLWTMSTVQSLTVEVAELRVEVTNLKADIAAIDK
ncbi:MAG: hypothetical protein MJH10_14630 [Epibacterium sp.]|nr:hypothetical protein [Epibacterium sp.]NQX74763.1 hypothetical protein [Epibacterium sp.]